VKNITAIIFCLAASISSLSIAERSIAAPNAIARLKNGKYLTCIKKYQPNVYDESQRCFEFFKQGSKIKGSYELSPEGPDVCITGTIIRNIITGSAYDNSLNSPANGVPFSELEELRLNLPTAKLTALDIHNYLQVAEGQLEISKVSKDIKTNPYNYSARVTYKKAKLDLGGLQYISSIEKISFVNCLK
jgi:hypothetical protein